MCKKKKKKGITAVSADPDPFVPSLFTGSLNLGALGFCPCLPFPVLGSAASRGFCGSCMPGPDLAFAVVPEPAMSVLLEEAGADVLAGIRLEKPGLVLTDPGAAFAAAGLTVMGLALTGGSEQMEERRTDFVSMAPADSD